MGESSVNNSANYDQLNQWNYGLCESSTPFCLNLAVTACCCYCIQSKMNNQVKRGNNTIDICHTFPLLCFDLITCFIKM